MPDPVPSRPASLMDVKHCLGCHNDFYNGKNPLGVKECWSRQTAKLVMRKAVHIDQCPPWTQKAKRYPSCYILDRHIFVAPEVVR